MSWISVYSPASIGNIGPGFDVLGLAVKGMGDVVQARTCPSGIFIREIASPHALPRDPQKNTVSIAAQEVLKLLGKKGGLELRIIKGLPPGSGLGSSAASAAAGAFAANVLYGNVLSKQELIGPATKAEAAVSGGFFADNTAPALLGGATLTRSLDPLDIVKLGTINAAYIILVTPQVKVLTKEARRILPKKIPMEGFVHNMAHASLIAAAFAKNDYNMFSRGLHDKVIEPVRSRLIPGYQDVKKAAMKAGADGMSISGSGPTVFAITNKKKVADDVLLAMIKSFKRNGVHASGRVTTIDNQGTRVITSSEGVLFRQHNVLTRFWPD